ncbi:hypothetical protein [Aliarcobacter cryaerophilus]|nr:hypothetical protein [Aliarcobacter cryaerophilus]QNM91946.1 hypothetical protein HOO33_08740 [Aliarcobacter cryaerophilus]
MRLLTDEQAEKLPQLYSTENIPTKGPLGLHIERDIHFKEQPFGQIKELQ